MRLGALLTYLAVLFGMPSCAQAHVIPNDANFQAFLKPERERLRMLVRVPLDAMVDLNYPTRGAVDEYLDLDRADFVLRELTSLWVADNLEMYENGRRLSYPQIVQVRAALAFDGSFASYDQALSHLRGPRLTNAVDFVWNQGWLDAMLEYTIESPTSHFSIRSKLDTLALRTTTKLTFLQPDGGILKFEYQDDAGLIELDPTPLQAASRFVKTGFLEILGGVEYWLFLSVLAIPFKRVRSLFPLALTFILAEALTLNPSASFAMDAEWFQPVIGLLIALGILYMAIQNGIGAGMRHRWVMAFGFGLLLGFRFSVTLSETLQFAGTHPLISLISFGVGVAAAQILLLMLFVPAVRLLFRYVRERAATIVLSLMAGDIAWHWTLDRAALVRRYPFQLPELTPALMLSVVIWATNLVIAAAVFWLLRLALRRFRSGKLQADTGTSIQ
jgi:hypothetical protein